MLRVTQCSFPCHILFFFNDTATTEIYTLSLHDALPISEAQAGGRHGDERHERRRDDAADHHRGHRRHELGPGAAAEQHERQQDRKSTRLNSSHANISYAVFCLKKKKKLITINSSMRSR